VVGDGRLEGIVTTAALARVPRAEWDQHTIADVMQRDLRALVVSPDTDALHALEQMQGTGTSRLLVTDGDRLVGLVSLKDLLGFLQLKLELELESVKDTRSWAPTPGAEGRQPAARP
jgi:predicted transcriptional regulator